MTAPPLSKRFLFTVSLGLFVSLGFVFPPQASLVPVLCHVVILRDYDLAFGYYAVPTLAPSCPAGAVGHLRKSSTLNTHRKGDPVQPIIPLKGFWTVTASGDDVPTVQQFTSGFSGWEWQDFVGGVWRKAQVW